MDQFDQFLQRASQQELQDGAERLRIEALEEEADTLIEQHGVVTPFRFNDERGEEASKAFWNVERLRFRDEALDRGIVNPHDQSIEKAYENLERVWLQDGARLSLMIGYRVRFELGYSDAVAASEAKKQVLTDLYMKEDDKNSPWIAFADAFLPGESFDPTSDIVHLAGATLDRANRDEYFTAQFTPLQVQLGELGLSDQDIKEMLMMAASVLMRVDSKDDPNFEAHVNEMIRMYQCERATIDEIFRYIEESAQEQE